MFIYDELDKILHVVTLVKKSNYENFTNDEQ